jgi:hypothetical protein
LEFSCGFIPYLLGFPHQEHGELHGKNQTSIDSCRGQLHHPIKPLAQKSPQGFHLTGFQDFSGRFWYRRERILVELAGVEPASEITTPSVLHA